MYSIVFVGDSTQELDECREIVIGSLYARQEFEFVRPFTSHEASLELRTLEHQKLLETSDLVIFLVGWLYGPVEEPEEKPVTYLQFQRVLQIKKQILVLMANNQFKVAAFLREDDRTFQLQMEFRQYITDHIRPEQLRMFADITELEHELENMLLAWRYDMQLRLTASILGNLSILNELTSDTLRSHFRKTNNIDISNRMAETFLVSHYIQESINENLPMITQTRILFIASDPTDASRLRTGQEIRDIKEMLNRAKKRDLFRIESHMSARAKDVTQAIHDNAPNVVHFSGHGTPDGELCLENELGEMKMVSPDALASLFKLVSSEVRCVILNACYSEIQARAIANHIGYVIGMNEAIGDKSAIIFSVGFYKALGSGKPVEVAFEFGLVELQLEGIEGDDVPILIKMDFEQSSSNDGGSQ